MSLLYTVVSPSGGYFGEHLLAYSVEDISVLDIHVMDSLEDVTVVDVC